MAKAKNIILGATLILASLVVFALQAQSASAYYSGYNYNSPYNNYNSGNNYRNSYYGSGYDRGYGVDGARIRVDLKEGNVDYDYYRYADRDPRYNPFYGYNYDYYYNRDFGYQRYGPYNYRLNIPDKYKPNEDVAFLADSFNNRYEATAGKTSGQAFCQGCKDQNPDPTNFRYRPAYNLAVDSAGGYGSDGYYAPRKSPITGAWNWNY